MNNERIIRAVLIDDDSIYASELSGLVRDYDIDLTHFTNLQKAKEEMDEMNNIDFIILDGKCFTEEDDTSPDFGFVSEALHVINEMEKKRDRKIPYCVYTGFIEEKKLRRYKEKMQVFEKVTEFDELIEYLIRSVKEDKEFQIKRKFGDIFEIFDKNYLGRDIEEKLTSLLYILEEYSPKKIVQYATDIRHVQEAIYKNLSEYYPEVLPPEYFKENGMIEFNKAKLFLSGKEKDTNGRTQKSKSHDIQGTDIENLSNTIYWTCGNIIHYDTNKVFSASMYTIYSLIYALLEQLLWYKKIITEKQK